MVNLKAPFTLGTTTPKTATPRTTPATTTSPRPASSGTPAQLKGLVAEADDHPKVTNQEVINYLAHGTTLDKAWSKARSFGVDPGKLPRGVNGKTLRKKESLPNVTARVPPTIPPPDDAWAD